MHMHECKGCHFPETGSEQYRLHILKLWVSSRGGGDVRCIVVTTPHGIIRLIRLLIVDFRGVRLPKYPSCNVQWYLF